MLSLIEGASSAVETTKQGYLDLLDRFPRSVTLLRSYSSFCDSIANQFAESVRLREHAEALESLPDNQPNDDTGSYKGSSRCEFVKEDALYVIGLDLQLLQGLRMYLV